MRARWNGGIADINPRLSRMIERIAPVREFEPAFQDEFKVSADAFAEAFTPPSCAPPDKWGNGVRPL
jgi:hypothetical protein